MTRYIDLNADLGEGSGTSRLAADTALLELVSSANIACGFHAGDAVSMKHTVRAARERGVTIGAHPSYPDLPGFGRRELGLDSAQIRFHVAAQLRILAEICSAEGATLAYVKPHGALYNRAARDTTAADAIVDALNEIDSGLTLLGLAHSAMERSAAHHRVQFAREAFIDRAYEADGTLVPRDRPGAVIHDVEFAAERALRLIEEGVIVAISGDEVRIRADSLCVHGDNAEAAAVLTALRRRLDAAGISVAPFVR